MRVVIVCDFGEPNGGAAQVAVTSARALADAGVDVTYVSAIGPAGATLDHSRIDTRCLGMDSVWDRPNSLAAASRGIWNRRARAALEAILCGLPRAETVVHFHQWSKALSPSVLLAPRRFAFPAIVSLHDYFFVCPNGAFYHFGRQAVCALAPLSAACLGSRCDRVSRAHKAVRVMRQFATRRAVARAGKGLAVLNVSAFAEHIVDRFIPEVHPRFVLPSPVDARCAPPVRVAENKAFLFVGRLTEEKGVLGLARLAWDAGLPLVVVGDGPLLGELSALGGSVRCTGWLDRVGVEAELAAARALIFPSRWYETGGLVVGEALARGVPAVVSRITAPADDIIDGVSGLVVPSSDAVSLLAAMRRLQDDGEAARMGAAAYCRYWSKPRTEANYAARLIEIYRAVLSPIGERSDISIESAA
jgi:glycosyltransferase involved in cell wall biosynthesis